MRVRGKVLQALFSFSLSPNPLSQVTNISSWLGDHYWIHHKPLCLPVALCANSSRIPNKFGRKRRGITTSCKPLGAPYQVPQPKLKVKPIDVSSSSDYSSSSESESDSDCSSSSSSSSSDSSSDSESDAFDYILLTPGQVSPTPSCLGSAFRQVQPGLAFSPLEGEETLTNSIIQKTFELGKSAKTLHSFREVPLGSCANLTGQGFLLHSRVLCGSGAIGMDHVANLLFQLLPPQVSFPSLLASCLVRIMAEGQAIQPHVDLAKWGEVIIFAVLKPTDVGLEFCEFKNWQCKPTFSINKPGLWAFYGDTRYKLFHRVPKLPKGDKRVSITFRLWPKI